ncbi:MAG: HD domain-containing protein [Candidatus Hydrogenedens sp.]|nr:HD domain-containing protein [Candidatus Hydrogenedens sp.]
MKNQYISMLQEGDRINDYFLATRKDLRTKTSGGKFLGSSLKDKTGEIGAVMWSNAVEAAATFNVGDAIHVRGVVGSHQGRLQIRMEQIMPLRPEDYAIEDLLYAPENTEAIREAYSKTLESITNPHCKALVDSFWKDDAFQERFCQAAAGKKWHHEFTGGLLHHCHEMSCLAETMCGILPELNRDLLLTAVFLHDIGKLKEMDHGMAVDYTTEGKLLGHIYLGCEMVQLKISAQPAFPERLKMEVLHCMLAHHGSLENGSPVTPRSLEALVLHHIDNLNAQAAAFARIIRESRSKSQEWSDYIPIIERAIWAG